jgi:hypothetical protein
MERWEVKSPPCPDDECDGSRRCVVERVNDHERSRVRSLGQRRGDLELIFKILSHFCSVDPEFHALGDTVKGVARGPEGDRRPCLASFGWCADVPTQRVRGWGIAVSFGAIVQKNQCA